MFVFEPKLREIILIKDLFCVKKNKLKKDLVIFFLPSLQKDEITLSESDSKHAIKVLRLKINDWVHLTNGKGLLVKGKINRIGH